MTTDQDFPEKLSLDIHAEDVVVGKRRLPDRTIRVATSLVTRDVVVDVNLTRDDVTIERVPVGRYVETMPEIRIEAGVSIMPVVEEEVVVTRRLFLREEVHVRRTRVTTNHVETVSLRQQDIVVNRKAANVQDSVMSPLSGTTSTDGRPVTDGSFSDKVIEMTETAEEAVISKTARVVEEVSLRKKVSDRLETVRDTVRKEEVKVEQLPGSPPHRD